MQSTALISQLANLSYLDIISSSLDTSYLSFIGENFEQNINVITFYFYEIEETYVTTKTVNT